MIIPKKIVILTLPVVLLIFSAQVLAETDCSRDAIGYYLDKGFSTEQVSRMCQASPQKETTAVVNQPSAIDGIVTGNGVNAVQKSPLNDDVLFFNKTILADSLTVTPETLTYIRDECITYGEEDISGFQPKVCGKLKTTINRVGLTVLSAVKGFGIFRDAELLVKGEIQREVINLGSLKSKAQKAFAKILDATPETFDIQTRKDADPKEIAARLVR